MKDLKIAVIGAGGMAREHIKAFKSLPGVQVAGVFSRTKQKADAVAADFGIGLVCNDIKSLYEKTKADIVIVAVTETSIRSIVSECFEFPWAVFMEKPPGIDYNEAKDLQKMAEHSARKVYVGLNRRFNSSTIAVKAELDKSGSRRYIHVLDQEDPEAAGRVYGYSRAILDTWMYANSIHVVDYLVNFGRGEITSVQNVIPWSAKKGVVVSKVEFSSGDIGIYEGIWGAPAPWIVSISTPEKRWEMRPLEQATFQNYGERKQNPVEIDKADQEFKPGFLRQAENVVAAVRGEKSNIPTLKDSLITMNLISQIF